MAKITHRRLKRDQVAGAKIISELYDNDLTLERRIDSLDSRAGDVEQALDPLEQRTTDLEESRATTEYVDEQVAEIPWGNVGGKPTTLEGYGITDGVTPAQLDAVQANVTLARAEANQATQLGHANQTALTNHEARLVLLEREGGGGGGGGLGGNFFDARCSEDLKEGDVVVPGGIGVELADPFKISSMPAVGIVARKITPTQARVQTAGVLWDVYDDLEMGTTYFTGVEGRPVKEAPQGPPDVAVQRIGVALSSTALLVSPSTEMFIDKG